MPEVFISYSRKDSDFAEVLRRRMVDRGFSSWIDLEGLSAGDAWVEAIDGAIRESVALVVILTPASCGSAYVAYEWAFALGAGVPVFPILLQTSPVHPRLSALQHLDFTQPDGRPWDSLFLALEEAARARPVHAIPVDRAAPAVVRDAAAALDDPNTEAMEAAVRRLAELSMPSADEVLVSALEHPLPDVRIAVGLVLGERRDVRAVPALIEGNRRRLWHYAFARRIAHIGSAALPRLREALSDPLPMMRRDLLWAMAAIRDRSAIPDLIRGLNDPDAEVRQEAALTLHRWGEPEGMQAVTEAMPRFITDLHSEDDRIQRLTAQFLDRLGTPAATAALTAWQAGAAVDKSGTERSAPS